MPNKKILKSESDSSMSEDTQSESEYFIVDKIHTKRVNNNGITEYGVQWKGYPISENTWEPKENLKNCRALVEQFEEEEKKKKKSKGRSDGVNLGEEIKDEGKAAEKDDDLSEGEGVTKSYNSKKEKRGPDMSIKTKFEKDLTPERILGATIRNGETVFIIKWANLNKANIVRAKDANILWPQVVIQFYEFHLVLAGKPLLSDKVITTVE